MGQSSPAAYSITVQKPGAVSPSCSPSHKGTGRKKLRMAGNSIHSALIKKNSSNNVPTLCLSQEGGLMFFVARYTV
jgi:hypothetical protein